LQNGTILFFNDCRWRTTTGSLAHDLKTMSPTAYPTTFFFKANFVNICWNH
jgi:hypothetical protein